MKNLFLILFCVLLVKTDSLSALPPNVKHRNKHLHFGIFFHYLYGLQNATEPWNQGKKTSWDECTNDLDVNKIADQVKAIGADYVIFTTEQIDKYFCFPELTYEKLTGYKPGEATSQRDVIADLYNALNKRGIKLFLYVTGDGPRNDVQARAALNNPSAKLPSGPFKVDEPWVKSWSRIIKSISLRYGDHITGWWFDGSYDFIGYNDALLDNYLVAAKTGNKSALVGFNYKGPQDSVQVSTIGNYTAGESDKFISLPSPAFKNNNVQWHILSYLGNGWAHPGLRYSADYMSTYIKKIKALNGMITIDVCLLRDGTIDPEQYNFLKNLEK